jgi:succinate dehydrogenase/fumarate reductase cytochrome b subunit
MKNIAKVIRIVIGGIMLLIFTFLGVGVLFGLEYGEATSQWLDQPITELSIEQLIAIIIIIAFLFSPED